VRGVGYNGAEEEVEVIEENLDEEVADLLDAGDVQVGEEGEDAGVFKHLVDLADKVHAAVEEEGFVIIAENGVSVGGGEEDDVCVEEFEAVEEGEVVGGVFGTFLEPFACSGAEVPYLNEWLGGWITGTIIHLLVPC
jgi:hypothetical protein